MIKYVKGDLFLAAKTEEIPIIIPHVCNNIGKFGSGFVVPLKQKYPHVAEAYYNLNSTYGYVLGETQIVLAEENVHIANMIGQKGIKHKYNVQPLQYNALEQCMISVSNFTHNINGRIIAPKFGAFRAGGDWSLIEEMINSIWKDIDITIYYI